MEHDGRLPRITELHADCAGWSFYLCSRKDVRTSRGGGEFIALVLQDATGQIDAKVFQDVDTIRHEFDSGEFVKVQGRSNLHRNRLELVVEKIRRVDPARDRLNGFIEEDCIPCAPRPVEDMWAELQGRLQRVQNPFVASLLSHVVRAREERLRKWPAALTVHHAYRGGLLEHILKVAETADLLATAYRADRDVVLAGAILHDIGKLDELDYDVVTTYSREGNLLGHIAMGLVLVREAAERIEGFPGQLRTEIEHLVVSHHGAREFGSPVEPMTIEAIILSAADDLDATIHQVRRHMAEDEGEGAFTSYHPRLKRVFFKPSGR